MRNAPPFISAPPPRRAQLFWLYFRAITHEFRFTLACLALVILVGGIFYATTAQPDLNNERPSVCLAIFSAWMALFAQSPFSRPPTWPLAIINGLYPVFGVLLIGEGVVRFAILMISRRHGEKEWMKVMASTYRDHVVLCGVGHLGYRVLEQLLASGVSVVAIEKDPDGRFVAQAKSLGVPVLIRDMKDDQAILDAGIAHARAVIIASNDDMANLEVALDARRMNPRIRVVMRLFDQQIAAKISGAFMVDSAFSSSALAAPAVAAMSLQAGILSSTVIAGIPHVTAQITVAPASPFAGQSIEAIERAYPLRVLVYIASGSAPQSPPDPAANVRPGDELIIHCRASDLPGFSHIDGMQQSR